MIKILRSAIVAAFSAILLNLAYAVEDPTPGWPDKVVSMEELRPLTAFRMKVPGVVVRGAVRGPSTLRVHIDVSGAVVKVILLESCGNGDLDEATMHAMRAMKFSPYAFDGTPIAVTLAVPIHVPKNLGRAR